MAETDLEVKGISIYWYLVMSSFIGQDQFEKIKYIKKNWKYTNVKNKAQKGWARTGHSDPCGVLTLGKYKDLKWFYFFNIIQKSKI